MNYCRLIPVVFLMAVACIPIVRATDSITTDKPTYSVNETITFRICVDGGTYSLEVKGPYSQRMDLGNLPAGCYDLPFGAAGQGDIGAWTATLYPDVAVPSAVTHFSVVQNPVPEFSVPSLVMALALIGSSLVLARSGRLRRVTNAVH
jgi:hypothetical protein